MSPKTADIDKALKRQHVVTSAAEVFAARGYHNATMDEIARLAGTAKGTLYLYFKDKESLFYAVFEWLTSVSFECSAAVERETMPAPQRLRTLVEDATRFLAEHRELFPLTLEVWAAGGSTNSRARFADALREMYARYRALIAHIIHTGQRCGELRADLDADALGATLTGAVDGLLLQCWFDPGLDPKPLLDAFFDPLIRGMRATNHGETTQGDKT
jgi:AcrR family transcriptional regulator